MSFPIGTKLLISLVLLIAVAITFLNISAIVLLREDKIAYTFANQSTQVSLAGREFVNVARHATDTLRLALGSVDPLQPPTTQQRSVLQSVLDNQSDVLGLRIHLIDSMTGAATPYASAEKEKELLDLKLAPADLEVAAESLKLLLPELKKHSFAFINLSKPGGVPLLGILLADNKLQSNATGMPVALGVVSLLDFGKSLAGLGLTVATRSGWVVYDTDPAKLYTRKNIAEDPLFRAALESKVASGTQQHEQGSEHYLGSYVNPGFELVALSKTSWKDAMRSTYSLAEKYILLSLMALGAAVIFAIFFSKTLTAPIKKLFQATKDVARGRFDLNLTPASQDEIGALTDSFNVMSRKIGELIQESMQKVQLENELAIASTVQHTLIPEPSYEDELVSVRSLYRSASTCGGDWWGFFTVGRKFCVMIADATGHGFPSALMTASARSCFSVLEQFAKEVPGFDMSPAKLLRYANRVIHDGSRGKIMMTFFIGVIDFDTMEIKFASAGHNPPWLFKKEGESFALKSLTASGTRLGDAADASGFEEKTMPISAGDVLFLYTDGLLEGTDATGAQYGKKRVRKILESTVNHGPGLMIDTLVDDFERHNGTKPLDDDITLAMIQVLPNAASSTVTLPEEASVLVSQPMELGAGIGAVT